MRIFRSLAALLIHTYSGLMIISCLGGCATKSIGNPSLERDGIVSRYEVDQELLTSPYLKALSRQISEAAGLNQPIDITVLRSNYPLALSISNGDIFVSSGLIKNLRDESSFVFVLAHELAHALLEHHVQSEPSPEFELQADRLALNITLLSGFPTDSIFAALIDSYSNIEQSREDSISSYFGRDTFVHPSLKERIDNMNQAIAAVNSVTPLRRAPLSGNFASFKASL